MESDFFTLNEKIFSPLATISQRGPPQVIILDAINARGNQYIFYLAGQVSAENTQQQQ